MANTPVLSPESWEALKAASIRGVSDKQLSEAFGVAEETIRTKRFRDEVWKKASEQVVICQDKQIETEIETKEPERAELAQKTAATIQEAIAGGKLQNELLLLKLAGNGLKSAEGNLPQVKAWADIKAIADIVSKIGPQASTAVQVNVLTDAPASVEHFEFPTFEADD